MAATFIHKNQASDGRFLAKSCQAARSVSLRAVALNVFFRVQPREAVVRLISAVLTPWLACHNQQRYSRVTSS